MFPNRMSFPNERVVEEELHPLLSPELEESNAMAMIRKINEEIFEKYERNLRGQRDTKCCIRYKEAFIGSGCGLIAVIVMAVWAAKTLPGELKAILEPALHGGYHGPVGHNSSLHMNQTIGDPFALSDDASDVSIPAGVIIYPIVKFTASAHVVGQVCTWAAELIGIKKPALSLREYRLLSKAIKELTDRQESTFTESTASGSDPDLFKSISNVRVVTGKRILCHQRKTYLQISVYFTFLAVEALLLYYIWMLAAKSINGISESFLKGLANKNRDESSANTISPYQLNDQSETRLTTYRGIRNITYESTAHLEEEMYGPIEQTLAVGVFTALTTPTVTLLSKIPGFVKEVYRSCRRNVNRETVEFDDDAINNHLVIDIE